MITSKRKQIYFAKIKNAKQIKIKRILKLEQNRKIIYETMCKWFDRYHKIT